MTRLVFAPTVLRDLKRLAEFLLEQSERQAAETKPLLIDGLQILKRHPLIGRPAEEGLRELLISRGRSGYVALYRYLVESDTVLVLAIRHQRGRLALSRQRQSVTDRQQRYVDARVVAQL